MAQVPASKILRALRNPAAAYGAVKSRIKGRVFKLWCRLFRPRVSIGSGLILEGKLKIRGSGRVVIGNNVVVGMLVTPYTYGADSVITIGDGAFLNGTRFGATKSITVGPRCILAECRITDCDFHSADPDHRNDPDYIDSRPVEIEENVWVALGCVVLKGARIGAGSTISANSVVRGEIPPYSIAGGNPATVWKSVRRS